MSSAPVLSILIPTYNAAAFLPRTLDSIRAQSLTDYEVFIVDDASTDNTREAIAPYLSDRIQYLRLAANSGGPSKPRNAGLRCARGQFIALCDSDDILLPDKYETAIQLLEAVPQVGFFFTDCAVIDVEDRIIRPRFLADYQNFRRALRPSGVTDLSLIAPEDAYREIIRADFIATSGVVFRRSLIDEIGPFDDALIFSETVDFWMRAARAGTTFGFLDRVGHYYRQRPGNQTSFAIRNRKFEIAVLEKQWAYVDVESDVGGILRDTLVELLNSYGWGLRTTGRLRAAANVLRRSLAYRFGWSAVRGLLLTTLSSFGNRHNAGAPQS
jgi:glycosyltransferase involved in cell wall biosynthesis